MKSLRHSPWEVKVFAFLACMMMGCIFFAPWLGLHDPNDIDMANTFSSFSSTHPLGTDYLGRDLLSRLLWGGRITLGYSLLMTAATGILGTSIGIVLAMHPGTMDSLVMGATDLLRSFPRIVIVLVLASIFGVGMQSVCLAMLLVRWIWIARMARSLSRKELARTSILASRLAGATKGTILLHHVLPGILPQMIGAYVLDFGGTLLSISGYSFLGLGVLPPDPEWGTMIQEGSRHLHHPIAMMIPGLAVLLMVMSANVLSDYGIKISKEVER